MINCIPSGLCYIPLKSINFFFKQEINWLDSNSLCGEQQLKSLFNSFSFVGLFGFFSTHT